LESRPNKFVYGFGVWSAFVLMLLVRCVLAALAAMEHFHNLVLKLCKAAWEHVLVGCMESLRFLEMEEVSFVFDCCKVALVIGTFVSVEFLDNVAFVVYIHVVGDLVDHNSVEELLVGHSLAFLVVHSFALVLLEQRNFASVILVVCSLIVTEVASRIVIVVVDHKLELEPFLVCILVLISVEISEMVDYISVLECISVVEGKLVSAQVIFLVSCLDSSS
jgi:hypothetical protein